MAEYPFDLTEYATVSDFLVDFDYNSNATSSDFSIQTDGVSLTMPDSNQRMFWPSSAGTSHTDVEVLSKGYNLDNNVYTHIVNFVRSSDAGDTRVYAELYFNKLRLRERDSSTITTIAEVTVSIDNSQPYYLRLRVNGGTAYAKIWQATDPEPSSWTVSGTTSLTSAGYAGAGNWDTISDGVWSFLSIGTNGDTAPKTTATAPPVAVTNLQATLL